MKPMLAESTDDRRAERLLADDDWCVSQKLDGHRVLVKIEDGKVSCLNRQGQPKATMITPAMIREFERFPGNWYFDGELVDGILYLFDMPTAPGYVDVTTPFGDRHRILAGLFERDVFDDDLVKLIPIASYTMAKTNLLQHIRDISGEGIMFRNVNSRYEAGRRSRHLLKYKFVHTIDCVVTAVNSNGKENLTLALYRDGRLVPVGDCTGRAGDGSAAFTVGSVAEVKYLYMGAGGRLYQPTFPILRTDKDPTECTFDQVVHVNKKVVLT